MPVDQIPIGTFSRITRLSQKALRHYDERGLLVPAARDICTGYRYYTFAQAERGLRIRHLLWLGFDLSEVEAVLAAGRAAMPERSAISFVRASLQPSGKLYGCMRLQRSCEYRIH